MEKEEIIVFVESRVGYTFKNKELLLEALTHSSYTNEMKINKRSDYERLEFLGDAVLELISSEFLYDKYPKVPEGGLSKKRASMVCEPSLAICARRMELGKAIFLGKGEEGLGGRDRDAILCDVTESVLGAIYLDGGIEPARVYVNTHILFDLKEPELFVDSKSAFQELVQKIYPGSNLHYDVIEESGPEHDKNFVVAALVDDIVFAEGSGKTKKAAQQMAAGKAIKKIKEQENDKCI